MRCTFRPLAPLTLFLLCLSCLVEAAPPKAVPWTARWIWLGPEANPRHFFLYARRTFGVSEIPTSAPARIAADTRYRLYVNGRFVGRGPARFHPANLSYDTYDLAPFLRVGKNVLAVQVWHCGVPTFQSLPAPAGLLFEAQIGTQTIASDANWSVRRADAWRQDTDKIDLQLPPWEEFDARKALPGWTQPDFDDSAWDAATVIGSAGRAPWVHLTPRDIPPLREREVAALRLHDYGSLAPSLPAHHIDFLGRFRTNDSFEAYAATYLYSGKAQQIEIGAGSDDGIRLWVGGKEVISHHIHRAAAPEQEQAKVRVEAGWTPLLVKIHQGHSQCELYLRATGSDGKPLPFSATKQPGTDPETASWKLIGPFDNDEKGEGEDGNTGGFAVAYPPEKELDWTKTYPGKGGKVTWADAQTTAQAAQANEPLAVQMQRETLRSHEGLVETLPAPEPLRRFGPAAATFRVTLEPNAAGKYLVLDFGQEVSGYPRLVVDAPAGTTLDTGYSELLENGRVVMNRADVHYADRYICREGTQEHERFGPRAFRYMQVDVRNATRPVTLTVTLNASGYPVEYRGQFACSDESLNRIWALGRRTVELCMDDGYMDCPWRERGQWWGDARVEGLTTYYAFGDGRLARRAITQIAQGQRADGLTPGVYPADFDNRWLPDFCLLWVMTIDDYIRYTGDKALAEEMWGCVARALDWFPQFINPQSGLLKNVPHWVFIDWADVDKNGESAALNAYYIGALKSAARLSDLTGHKKEAAAYRALADKQSAAWNARFWNEAEGAYVDAYADAPSKTISEQTNALGIVFDIAPFYRWNRMFARLDEKQTKPTVRCGSPYFSFYWLWAMHHAGRHQQALDYTRAHYGEMLKAGATSAWEVWGMGASLCHGWSSAPTNLLPAYIAGIRPAPGSDGWQVVRLNPTLGDLKWASATVPTPLGAIEARWEQDGKGALQGTVTIPDGVETYYEAAAGGVVEIDGMRTQPTHTENGRAYYRLQPGRRHIQQSAGR